jgi:FkbM family methyltransferase
MTGPAALVRGGINRVVGDRIRVVTVRSGAARGCRLALDLSKEKAYWLGTYESAVQRFLRESIAPGAVFYDVGAHIGFFSVCAAKLGATVVAIEPDPSNVTRLKRNAELNGFDIRVIEAAAWSQTGEVAFASGESTKEGRAGEGVGTRSVTIDEIAAQERPPTVVTLDVEGAEVAALSGARRVLRQFAPVVLCEVHGEQRDLVVECLKSYRIETLDGGERIVGRKASE